jgi:hypothetical protein
MPEQAGGVKQQMSDQDDAPIPATGDTCILVIGMHRSGTSATSGLLCALGLNGPVTAVRMRPTQSNEKGFFEAKILNRFDERLLVHLGGTWDAPRNLPPGWENDPGLEPYKSEAVELFAKAFGPRPIAWKDPRTSVLLPFWRGLIEPPLAAVFVYRHPYEVASSLRSRDKLRITTGFASWERHIRMSARDLDGIPTYCMNYETLLESPEDQTTELVKFLGDVGVTVDPAQMTGATDFLDSGLRHERARIDESEIPRSVSELDQAMSGLTGAHHPWRSPDFGKEPEWVEDVLSSWIEINNLQTDNADLYMARPMRWARTLDGLVKRKPKR